MQPLPLVHRVAVIDKFHCKWNHGHVVREVPFIRNVIYWNVLFRRW